VVNPAERGEFRVFNQFTEQFSVLELAEKVAHARAEHGLETLVEHAPNPRVEKDEHYYNAKHQHLLDLGLQPHYLQETLIEDVIARVEKHRSRVRPELVGASSVDWRGNRRPRQVAVTGHAGGGALVGTAGGRRTVAAR
jgi:UDP-sulfoquinovose synthase